MLKKIFTIVVIVVFLNNNIIANSNNISIIKDLETEDFIKTLLQPIFNIADIDVNSINVYIVDNATPNAFVYNGQNIFIHSGLLAFADNAQEIAGVLAHELGHITAGHLSRGEIAYNKANLLVILGLGSAILASIILANTTNNVSENSGNIIAFLGASANNIALNNILTYTKAEETQADQIAVMYLSNTMYGTSSMLSFMEKLEKLEDKSLKNHPFSWYTTHPSLTSRINFFKNNNIAATNNAYNKEINQKFLFVKAKIIAFNNTTNIINNYKNSNNNDAIYAKAYALYLNKEYKKAIELFNTLLKNNINSVYIKDILGDIFYEQHNFNEAIKYYNQLVNDNLMLDYHKDIIFFKLAKSHYAIKEYALADTNINISLHLNNNNPAAWYLKSLISAKIIDNPNYLDEANLALAEYYYTIQQYQLASYFAKKSILGFANNSLKHHQAELLIQQSIIKSKSKN